MREFEFSSGDYRDDPGVAAIGFRADTPHGPAVLWTQADLFATLRAHMKKFGPYRTQLLMLQITEAESGADVVSRYYGILIMALCRDMTSRPHRVKSNA